MKSLTCIVLGTLFSARAADAANISLIDFTGSGGSFQENVIRQATGEMMPNGSGQVRVGYFVDFDPMYLNCSLVSPGVMFSYIELNFVPLGEGEPGFGIPAVAPGFTTRTVNGIQQSGRLAGVITGINPAAAPPNTRHPAGVPAGSRLFLLVLNETSTQLGVFSATTWLMPANSAVGVSLSTLAVNTPEEIFVGTFGSLVLSPFCPEPGSATLSLTAAGVLIVRRRRTTG